MGGMGEKEKYKMYRIVDESECKRYRSDCSHVLKKTCALLKEKCINAQFTLVGSGARNMVTRNGNGPFDLDYKLCYISKMNLQLNLVLMLQLSPKILMEHCAG